MSSHQIDQPEAGNDVISSDGEKVGTVAAIGDGYLLVEKGFFFVTDYRIPASAIASYNTVEHAVYLNVTKDDALSSGWEVDELTDDEYYAADVEGDTYDSPIDGDGNTVMTGAASTPSLPILEEDDDPVPGN